jgi:hypothetical protein
MRSVVCEKSSTHINTMQKVTCDAFKKEKSTMNH